MPALAPVILQQVPPIFLRQIAGAFAFKAERFLGPYEPPPAWFIMRHESDRNSP